MPEPETPLIPSSRPRGKPHGDVFQVVFAGAADRQHPAPIRRAPPRREGHRAARSEISPGQTRFTINQTGGRSLVDHLPSPFAAPGAHVDHLVAEPDHVRVVFDDGDRVPQVHQSPQLRHEALLVAGVQTDAGFIENVEHVHQRRSQGPGQVHPLHLAPRKGPGLAVKGQVFQPYLVQELQPTADFTDQERRRRVALQLRPGTVEEGETSFRC